MPPLLFVWLRFSDEDHVDDVGQIDRPVSGFRHDLHAARDGVKAADPAADGAKALGMVDGDRNRAALPQGGGKGAGACFLLLGIEHGPRQHARRALLVEKGLPVFRQQDPVPGVKKVVPVIAQKGQRVPLLRRLEVMDVSTNKKKTFFGRHGGRLLAILIGALLVAVGLELFLIPPFKKRPIH